jgi:RND family efflux transporter MFP subunit
MKKSRKTRFVLFVIATLLVGASAFGAYTWQKKSTAAPVEPVVEVTRGSLTETASASGKVEPHVQVEVKSRGSGQVIEVLVTEGEQVKPGQLLVRLDPTDATRNLAEAKVSRDRVRAEVAAAQASLAVAELEKKNNTVTQSVAEKSVELGLGSSDAARSATHSTAVAAANEKLRRAQVSSAAQNLKAADLAVLDAELRLKETSIYAPIAGTVLNVGVEIGTLVSSALTNVGGGSAVMTLADLSDLRITGSIDQAEIGRVKKGQSVEIRVDAYPERVFRGAVERVSPLGTETSSVVTFAVEIQVVDKEASLLRSGMSADVEIITSEQKGVVLLPLLAVRSSGKRRFVRLLSGEERTIETGATDGSHIAVLKGLSPGDRVLAGSTQRKDAAAPNQPGGQNPMRGMGLGGPPARR